MSLRHQPSATFANVSNGHECRYPPSPKPSPTPSSVEPEGNDHAVERHSAPPRRSRLRLNRRASPEDPNEERWGPKVWHNDGGHWRWYYRDRPPTARPVQPAQPAAP